MSELFVNRVLQGTFICEPDDSHGASDLIAFQRWRKDLKQNTEDLRKIVLLEIEARLRRMVLRDHHFGKETTESLTIGEVNKAELMAAFIAQNYTNPLRTQDIADAVGLHQDYAMRLFRKTFNTTLVDYVNQLRVMHAQRLLVTTNDKIVAVAMDSGFGSVSRFNKVFKDKCGMSPRQYRESQTGFFSRDAAGH